eukprot:s94_g71.t1
MSPSLLEAALARGWVVQSRHCTEPLLFSTQALMIQENCHMFITFTDDFEGKASINRNYGNYIFALAKLSPAWLSGSSWEPNFPENSGFPMRSKNFVLAPARTSQCKQNAD